MKAQCEQFLLPLIWETAEDCYRHMRMTVWPLRVLAIKSNIRIIGYEIFTKLPMHTKVHVQDSYTWTKRT